MSKSRLKSDAEYSEILGVESEDTTKTISDANKYFSKINEDRNEKTLENPFTKTVTIQDIKQSLTKDKTATNVEIVKKEIASAQKETNKDYEEIDEIVVKPRESNSYAKEFSFEENAKKLYENLRGGSLVSPVNKALKEEHAEKNKLKVQEVEIVEPVSISEERVTSDSVPSKEEVVVEQVPSQVNDVIDNLELTADFTKENNNFIEAINQQKQEIKVKEEISTNIDVIEDVIETSETIGESTVQIPEVKDIEVHTPQETLEEAIEDVRDIKQDLAQVESNLEELQHNDMLEELFGTKTENVSETLETELSNLGNNVTEGIDVMSEKGNTSSNEDLRNTLRLALSPEDTTSFTNTELDMLKNENSGISTSPKKKSTLDVIMTITLVIMIIVVIILVIFYLKNN